MFEETVKELIPQLEKLARMVGMKFTADPEKLNNIRNDDDDDWPDPEAPAHVGQMNIGSMHDLNDYVPVGVPLRRQDYYKGRQVRMGFHPPELGWLS